LIQVGGVVALLGIQAVLHGEPGQRPIQEPNGNRYRAKATTEAVGDGFLADTHVSIKRYEDGALRRSLYRGTGSNYRMARPASWP